MRCCRAQGQPRPCCGRPHAALRTHAVRSRLGSRGRRSPLLFSHSPILSLSVPQDEDEEDIIDMSVSPAPARAAAPRRGAAAKKPVTYREASDSSDGGEDSSSEDEGSDWEASD